MGAGADPEPAAARRPLQRRRQERGLVSLQAPRKSGQRETSGTGCGSTRRPSAPFKSIAPPPGHAGRLNPAPYLGRPSRGPAGKLSKPSARCCCCCCCSSRLQTPPPRPEPKSPLRGGWGGARGAARRDGCVGAGCARRGCWLRVRRAPPCALLRASRGLFSGQEKGAERASPRARPPRLIRGGGRAASFSYRGCCPFESAGAAKPTAATPSPARVRTEPGLGLSRAPASLLHLFVVFFPEGRGPACL